MPALEDAADLPIVDIHERRGAHIKQRRIRLGLDSERAFAEATGVDRRAIASAEAGDAKTQRRTFERLEAWLDERERENRSEREEAAELAGDAGGGEPVRIEMSGVYGIDHIVFAGPPDQADTVRRLAVDFMRDLRDRDRESNADD